MACQGDRKLIHLVTGTRGEGKTRTCINLANKFGEIGLYCGGVICPGVYDGGEKTGSRIIDVKTREASRFSSRKNGGDYGIEVGEWLIHHDGIEFGIQALKNALHCHIIFVDEVGPLELSGRGFSRALHDVFNHRQVIVVLRDGLRGEFASKFHYLKFREYDLSNGVQEIVAITERVLNEF